MIRSLWKRNPERRSRLRSTSLRRQLLVQSLEGRRLLAANPFPDDFKFDSPAVSDFSVGFWFNSQNDQTTDVAILSNKDWGGGGNPGFIFTQRGNGDVRFNLNTAGGSRVDSVWSPVTLGEWTHVAASFDRTAGAVSFYINGTLTGTAADPTLPMAKNFPQNRIDTWDASSWLDLNVGQDGTGNYAGGQSFKGQVDDVAIWRRALDVSEISAIYTGGTAATPQSLDTLIGATASLGTDLVGLYEFDDSLADESPTINALLTAKDGIHRTTGPAGTASFVPGLFGQAIDLRDLDGNGRGDEFITLGDAVAPPGGGDASFTGAAATDNDFVTAGNWDVDPAGWILPGDTNFLNGTRVFVSANTTDSDPAVLQSGDDFLVENFVLGGGTEPVFVSSTGGRLIGGGSSNSVIGRGAEVSLTMTGGEISHYGDREEGSELQIGGGGGNASEVSVEMGTLGSSENPVIASGPFLPDPSYATGYRRLLSSDELGDRLGDDIKLGLVSGDDVSLVMNGESMLMTVDVLYPLDTTNGVLSVVQNDNSQAIALWDTRFMDTGGATENYSVDWTLNDNAKFLVGRDHGLGERSGEGLITINVNGPGAQFGAGDRIAIGSGGGNVTVNVNDGLMKVGGDSPNDILLVDPTGEPTPGAEPRTVDWVLLMGSNAASSNLNVSGGRVEIGRSAYVGVSDGGTANAKVFVDGGVFEVKGVGPSDPVSGLQNIGNIGAAGTGSVLGPWFDGGGDVFVGMSSNDVGTLHYRSGEVSIARDLNVGFGIADGNEGVGTLVLEGLPTAATGNAFNVGGVLAFGYDFILDADLGAGGMQVVLNEHMTPVVLTDTEPFTEDGNVYIGSGSEFSLDLATGYRPATGENVGVIDLIQFSGDILGTAGSFAELPSRDASGIDYSLIYDDVNDVIQLSLDRVYLPGDLNFDGVVNALDLSILASNWLASDVGFSGGDINGDGVVNALDLSALAANWLKTGPSAPVALAATADSQLAPVAMSLESAEPLEDSLDSAQTEDSDQLSAFAQRSKLRAAASTVASQDQAVSELYTTSDSESDEEESLVSLELLDQLAGSWS